MELMSMLLCAFVAMLPQALGTNGTSNSEIKLNTTIITADSAPNRNKSHQVWNIAFPFYSVTTELQALFLNQPCKYCTNCMEKALRAQKNHSNDKNVLPAKDLFHNIIEQENQQTKFNNKRSIGANNTTTKADFNFIQSKAKSVTATVTKYTNEEGKVYALRVNEINNPNPASSDASSSCFVYSVKKSLPCQSGNTDALLKKNKKKNKKSKKSKQKNVTTEKAKPETTLQRKREARVDNSQSQVQESYMPSIELY